MADRTNDADFLLDLVVKYVDEDAKKENKDYKVNCVQMKKYLEALEFFYESFNSDVGRVTLANAIPKREYGEIEIILDLFFLEDNMLKEFQKIFQHISYFLIASTDDNKIRLYLQIPNVYIHK